MPTSPIPAVEALQNPTSAKKDRPKSKLYETFQKVRRNTFNSSKEEEERPGVKTPPVSSGGNPQKTKPRLQSRGTVISTNAIEKGTVPAIVVSSSYPATNENMSQRELVEVGTERSMDSINDLQEMPTQVFRRSNLNNTSELDVEAPGTPMLRESTRSNFTNRFPEIDDVLLQYHSCAWERDILWQGRLYITKSCLCFYAKIFGNEVKLLLRFNEITSIEKSVVVGLIPNSITITSKGQRYFFASFMKRDIIYDYLICLWTNCKDCDTLEPKPEMKLETNFDTPSTIPSANNSAVSSAVNPSLPSLPYLPKKLTKLATAMDLEETKAVVNSAVSFKGAVIAAVSAFVLAIILKYLVWNNPGMSTISIRDELQFQKQMHLKKVDHITGNIFEKNLLMQQKLSGFVGSSLPSHSPDNVEKK